MQNKQNLYFNDYQKMLGVIFSNTDHEYIQLPKYYDIIAKLKTKPMMGYAMTLHHHLSGAMCNRRPSPRKDICLYIENEKGRITNKDEMEKFLSEEGYLKNNGAYLLNLASSATWYSTLKNLLDVGLLDLSGGKLRSMIPIEGRFLPIPYAYVAFLSRLKRDSNIRNSISEKLSKIPEELTQQLQDFNKDDLINEIVNLQTKDLKIHNKSELFKSLYSQIKKEFPHKWGQSQLPSEAESNANSFLDKVLEKIPSLGLDALDSIKTAQKQLDTEYREKVSLNTLKIDPEMTHAFEVAVTPKIKNKKVEQSTQSQKAAKFYGAVIEPIKDPLVATNENAGDSEEIEEIEYDIFGIEVDQTDRFYQNEIDSDTNINFDPNEFWK